MDVIQNMVIQRLGSAAMFKSFVVSCLMTMKHRPGSGKISALSFKSFPQATRGLISEEE